jgi:hypothetical protein
MAEHRLAHEFYIELGIENIERGLGNLETSANVSNNSLMRAVINNIRRELLSIKPPTKNQLF